MDPKHVNADDGSSVMTDLLSLLADILSALTELVPPEQHSTLLVISAFIAAIASALWLSAIAVRNWLSLCSILRGRRHVANQDRIRELTELHTDLRQYIAAQNQHGWHPDLEPVEGRIRVRKRRCVKWKLAPGEGSSDEAWRDHLGYIIPYLEASSLKEAQRETRRVNANLAS